MPWSTCARPSSTRTCASTLEFENLADKLYYNPLGGIDIADYRAGADSLIHSPLAAMGRTVYGGVTVKF